jgi:hypothetical protein
MPPASGGVGRRRDDTSRLRCARGAPTGAAERIGVWGPRHRNHRRTATSCLFKELRVAAANHHRVARLDEGRFWVAIRVHISDPADAFVELTHQTRDDREGDRIVRDRVRLVSTVPTYGGRRWWFQCPRTYRKTTKLFLPNGGRHFWSRQAYRLGYTCQREEGADRLRRKAAKLSRQLVVRRNHRIPYWGDACDNGRCARGSISS